MAHPANIADINMVQFLVPYDLHMAEVAVRERKVRQMEGQLAAYRRIISSNYYRCVIKSFNREIVLKSLIDMSPTSRTDYEDAYTQFFNLPTAIEIHTEISSLPERPTIPTTARLICDVYTRNRRLMHSFDQLKGNIDDFEALILALNLLLTSDLEKKIMSILRKYVSRL